VIITGTIAYVVIFGIQTRREEAKIVETVTQAVLTIRDLSDLEVYEVKYLAPHTLTFPRKLLSDFSVTAIVSGNIIYRIQIDSITYNKERSLVGVDVYGSLNHISYVNHKESYFVNPEWRFGYNEFEMADTLYKRAEIKIDSVAYDQYDLEYASKKLVDALLDKVKVPNLDYNVKLTTKQF
jgi:hypothetical protein